ncbi:TM2 domain-containing protein [Novosphingobium sp. NPDC080210]|uniref:TM2 domain-containing protein n=1 Tax=Novosphingobium sp. NPDC080210 TaxID=3390596 RepID=UPI003CFCF521
MALSTAQLQLIEQRVANDTQSIGAAYFLWFFLGLIGAHRFYLRRPGSGIAMLLTIGGFGIWWLIDIFLIPGMVRQSRETLRQRLTTDMLATGAVEPLAA